MDLTNYPVLKELIGIQEKFSSLKRFMVPSIESIRLIIDISRGESSEETLNKELEGICAKTFALCYSMGDPMGGPKSRYLVVEAKSLQEAKEIVNSNKDFSSENIWFNQYYWGKPNLDLFLKSTPDYFEFEFFSEL